MKKLNFNDFGGKVLSTDELRQIKGSNLSGVDEIVAGNATCYCNDGAILMDQLGCGFCYSACIGHEGYKGVCIQF